MNTFIIIWLAILTIIVCTLLVIKITTKSIKIKDGFIVINKDNSSKIKDESIIIGIEKDRFIVAEVVNGVKHYYFKNGKTAPK